MHIFPGVEATLSAPNTLRVSYGTQPTLVLGDLHENEIAWILNQFEKSSGNSIADCERSRIAPRQQRSIERVLVEHGFASEQRAMPAAASHGPHITAELESMRRLDKAPMPLLERRRTAVVAVRGLNRPMLAAIRTLCESGVEKFVIDDESPSSSVDLLADPQYPTNTATRKEAVSRMVNHISPRATVLSQSVQADIVINSSYHQPDYLAAAQFAGFDIPHLNVQVSSRNSVVGPLVIPGHTMHLCCSLEQMAELLGTGAGAGMTSGLQKTGSNSGSVLTDSVHSQYLGALTASKVLMYLESSQTDIGSSVLVVNQGSITATKAELVPSGLCLCAHSG